MRIVAPRFFGRREWVIGLDDIAFFCGPNDLRIERGALPDPTLVLEHPPTIARLDSGRSLRRDTITLVFARLLQIPALRRGRSVGGVSGRESRSAAGEWIDGVALAPRRASDVSDSLRAVGVPGAEEAATTLSSRFGGRSDPVLAEQRSRRRRRRLLWQRVGIGVAVVAQFAAVAFQVVLPDNSDGSEQPDIAADGEAAARDEGAADHDDQVCPVPPELSKITIAADDDLPELDTPIVEHPSLAEAAGGAKDSALRHGALLDAGAGSATQRIWDFTDGEFVMTKRFTFHDVANTADYSDIDAIVICRRGWNSTPVPGFEGLIGVRQVWKEGPPGFWAGLLTSGHEYLRAYARGADEEQTLARLAAALIYEIRLDGSRTS